MEHRGLMRTPALLLLAFCLTWLPSANGADRFVIEDIEVVGLQRITEGTLFNYLPLSIGDELTPDRTAQAIHALFDTGFFRDVELRRDGDTLIVAVHERPTIARFSVTGNRDIEDDVLHGVLRSIGLAEGRIFNRAMLDTVEIELRRQYFNRGKYGVVVDTEVTEVGDNMVSVSIEISEGRVARIRQVNIVGNEVFDDKTIRGELELRPTNWLSWYRKDDQYAREKLEGDLETLRSFYMDQGFADFEIESTQVAISPDKREIYITINIHEGEMYELGSVQLAGDLIIDEEEMQEFVRLETGQTFSRREITETTELIKARLGEDGFAYAEVTPLPDVDEELRIVNLVLFVDPGSRVYVRRINFTGGGRTNDVTYRREMRQLEGAWVSGFAIDRSRLRLQRLPWVEEVEIDTVPVSGSEDLVDIDVSIDERTPGNFNFGVGYSSAFQVMLNVNVTHSNFLGQGKRASVDLNRSRFNEFYSLNYTDPYHTIEGISRSFNVFYQSADQLFARTSPFFVNAIGAGMNYGIPMTEFSRLHVGASVRNTELIASQFSSQELIDWVTTPGHGSLFTGPGIAGTEFNTLEVNLGWSTDTRNRAIFADRGSLRRINTEISVPPGDVQYVMMSVLNRTHIPLTENLSVSLGAEAAAGKAMGDASRIPPYKHFFAGGPDSVRGWRESWLGPRDSLNRPHGGNIKLFGQAELVARPPWEALSRNTRFSLFYDVGNVFQGRNNVELDELRMSVGMAATWLAPMGAMRFSFAFPLNQEPGDQLERFQFSLGTAF